MKKTVAVLMASLMCMGGAAAVASPNVVKPVSAYAITQSQQQQFINNLGTAAQKGYAQYKILPSMTIAQAILESAWGQSTLSSRYYNFFGMKAGSNYHGETVTLQTTEEINGVLVRVNGTFRAYHSFDQGIEGYYQFITGYSRYSNLIGETDYKAACRKIREDGWATDSGYTNKLISLIERYDLTRFDTMVPVTEGYFRACASSYTSIVDALNSIGAESSFAYRKKIAAANNITNYSGTPAQNTTMLNLLKQGRLKKPSSGPSIVYFPACGQSYNSIVDALVSIGADSSYNYRCKIAAANSISGYSGTPAQNTSMLSLLKAGKLIKPN